MSLPEYSHMFSDMEMSRIRYGHASVWHLCVTILTEMEQLKGKEGVFHKTIVEKLEAQFKLVQELEKLIQEHFRDEFIKLFTRGPQTFDRFDGANNVFLDQVKLGTLGRGLMARFNWAISRLFRNDNPNECDPYSITYNRLASTTLSDFADSMKRIWNKMPNTFGESFGEAVKLAVTASKEDEKKNPKEQRPRRQFDTQRRAGGPGGKGKVFVKGAHPHPNPKVNTPGKVNKPAVTGPKVSMGGLIIKDDKSTTEKKSPDLEKTDTSLKSGEVVKEQTTDTDGTETTAEAKPTESKPVENVWRKRMAEKAEKDEKSGKTNNNTTKKSDGDTDKKTLETDELAPDEDDDSVEFTTVSTETEEATTNPNTTKESAGKNGDWETVNRKRTVDVEIEVGGKKFVVKAKVLPNGTYKQVGQKKNVKQFARR